MGKKGQERNVEKRRGEGRSKKSWKRIRAALRGKGTLKKINVSCSWGGNVLSRKRTDHWSKSKKSSGKPTLPASKQTPRNQNMKFGDTPDKARPHNTTGHEERRSENVKNDDQRGVEKRIKLRGTKGR